MKKDPLLASSLVNAPWVIAKSNGGHLPIIFSCYGIKLANIRYLTFIANDFICDKKF